MKIFLTYNAKSEIGQVLAIRLYTIGNLHGLEVSLPERSEKKISAETRQRIESCDWLIHFGPDEPKGIAREEMIVAYDRNHSAWGKLIHIGGDSKSNMAFSVKDAFDHIKENWNGSAYYGDSKGRNEMLMLQAFITIGIGMMSLAISSSFSSEQ